MRIQASNEKISPNQGRFDLLPCDDMLDRMLSRRKDDIKELSSNGHGLVFIALSKNLEC